MRIEETPSNKLNRRGFLGGMLPLVALATGSTSVVTASPSPKNSGTYADGTDPFPGLIIREKQPVNLEFPFPVIKERVIPNNRFFVRSHFSIPKIEADAWELTIGGDVRNEYKIKYDELLRLPSKTVMATIECAGNGRAYLIPKAKGLLWEQGGIGNAEWTGVPLSTLLNKAGIKPGVIEVVLEGADQGEITEEPKSPGAIKFARSFSVTKAMQPEVILAYKMNGKDLSSEHGFPVRAIIPGYYGMASVKWITRITATSTPYEGYWQSLEYAYWKRKDGLPTLTPVTAMLVKSEIARPMLHEVLPAAKSYRIFGATWVGESEVIKVEVSTDGGVTWQQATLLDKAIQFAWRLWEFNWLVPAQPGNHFLMARATDKLGNVQPTKHDPDKRNYMINHSTPIEVTVE